MTFAKRDHGPSRDTYLQQRAEALAAENAALKRQVESFGSWQKQARNVMESYVDTLEGLAKLCSRPMRIQMYEAIDRVKRAMK